MGENVFSLPVCGEVSFPKTSKERGVITHNIKIILVHVFLRREVFLKCLRFCMITLYWEKKRFKEFLKGFQQGFKVKTF